MRHLKFLITLSVTLSLLNIFGLSQAALVDPLTTIDLEVPVHFLSPDGSDVVVEAGTYTIEPAEEWIRLMSGERHDALLIEAKKGTHELDLEQAMAMSVPGESEDEQDNHHVMLLLPGGESLDATGSYSGIRGRGFFKKTFNRVKKAAKNTYRKARSAAKKATSKAKTTVQGAKKQGQRLAKQGVKRAKKGVQNVRKQIKKTRKKAVTRVRKFTQSARNAALHTKREIEKKARNLASGFKRRIQKARQSFRPRAGRSTFMKLAKPFANPGAFSPPIGVDHDRKRGRNDLDCLSFRGLPFPACYDNHEGSDFMINPLAMATGSVDVLAAAPGKVVNATNTYFDRCYFDPRKLGKKEKINCAGADPQLAAGNYVEILQDDGLYARYAHMKKGSVKVKKGWRVKCGQKLGKVASSGRSSAPHLHFDLHRDPSHKESSIVDPYAHNLWVSLDLKAVPNGRCSGGRSSTR